MQDRPVLRGRLREDDTLLQPPSGSDERLAELEHLFLNLVNTVEGLADRQAAANRRLAAFELERVAEGRAA